MVLHCNVGVERIQKSLLLWTMIDLLLGIIVARCFEMTDIGILRIVLMILANQGVTMNLVATTEITTTMIDILVILGNAKGISMIIKIGIQRIIWNREIAEPIVAQTGIVEILQEKLVKGITRIRKITTIT